MQYRNFGKLAYKPSALGFGTMRLPIIAGDDSNIDEEKAIKMIRYAINHGVNYIDTAWPYHEQNSELLVRKALQDGYREKVKLATKLPSWEIKEKKDMDDFLNKQLERLETDHIDFYLLHSLNQKYWNNYLKLDVFTWIDKVLNEGKIKHIGFSFHDHYHVFKDIIDSSSVWDFCQIQYNYLDTNFQAGMKGLKYAASKGLAVIIMEPLRGGMIAGEQPKVVQNIWNNSPIQRTAADWALQWLWNQPEVSLVLSGMSSLNQVKENIVSANNSRINSLSKTELDIVKKVRSKYLELSPINCTGCSYCMPCPNEIFIPGNFRLYNEAHIYQKFTEKREEYKELPEKAQASHCLACGACENICPQNLEIIKLLRDVAYYFA